MNHDGIEIIHGDCLSVMRGMADGSVDAVVTDPPFGTEAEKDGYGRRQNYGGVGRFIEGDANLDALSGMLDEANRVLAPRAWLAIFCSPKRRDEVGHLIAGRFTVAGEVVWDKASPGLGGGIRYQHELILLCKKGEIPGRGSLFSVIRCHLSRENKHLRHPHEKPVPVLTELVRYCSLPGQLVLDPFAGAGTTAVACMKTGRRCVVIESDARYIPVIERRVAAAATPLFACIAGGGEP